MMLFHFGLFMIAAAMVQADESSKIYQVKKIHNELLITGKGDDPLWKEAHELASFVYPWEKEKAPFTSFKALHNEGWLYCLFTVTDENIFTTWRKKIKRMYLSLIVWKSFSNRKITPPPIIASRWTLWAESSIVSLSLQKNLIRSGRGLLIN